ncbi:MAG: M23 family metallopeptidase [bacterium]
MLLVVAAVGIGAYDYYSRVSENQDLLIVKSKYGRQREIIKFFGSQVDSIRNEFREIKTINRKFLQIAGVPDTSEQPALGMGSDPFPSLETMAMRESEESIQEMAGEMARLKADITSEKSKLLEYSAEVEEKTTLLSATPSIWPVRGWMTSGFGARKSPFTGRREMHGGIDIATRFGTPVMAAAEGVVIYSGYRGGFGKEISIDHGFGYVTGYGHTSETVAKVGDKVKKGQIIAYVGSTGRSTGPHLHYEIKYNGVSLTRMIFFWKNNPCQPAFI